MPLVKDFWEACRVLEISTRSNQSEIKKAYQKKLLKYDVDKWKQKTEVGKRCKDGKCGIVIRDGTERYFHSEECKKTYEKVARNHQRVQEAYNILTGRNNSSDSEEKGERSRCDYCQKNFLWNSRYPNFKSLAKGFGRDKEEYFWFCSLKCYNNFFVCHFCGQKSKPGENVRSGSGWILKDYLRGTGYAFCSLDHKQKANQSRSSNNQQKCYQCGGDAYQKNAKGETILFYPPEDRDKLFCSSECIEEWRKSFDSQQNIEVLRSEAINAINDFLSTEPEVTTEELEPSNRNWATSLQNADKEEDIRLIKLAILEDARKKRAAKSGKSRIVALLESAKTKNDFEELFSIIKQLKELRLTEGYQEYQAEIEEQEARLKVMNPQEYSKRINGSFDEQIKNRGLTYEELSVETKAAMEEAKRNGEPQKVKIAEELIEVDNSIKSLNQLLTQVNQTQAKLEKQKLLNELLIFIEENMFNQRAYQKNKREVDKVVNQLIRETQTKLNSPEDFPYLPIFLILMAVLVVGTSCFLIWKRKQRS